MTVKTIGKYDGFRLSTEGGEVVLRLKKGDKIYLKPLDGGGIVPWFLSPQAVRSFAKEKN